jgi:hypothetical protein
MECLIVLFIPLFMYEEVSELLKVHIKARAFAVFPRNFITGRSVGVLRLLLQLSRFRQDIYPGSNCGPPHHVLDGIQLNRHEAAGSPKTERAADR